MFDFRRHTRIGAAPLAAIPILFLSLQGLAPQDPAVTPAKRAAVGPSCMTSECHADYRKKEHSHGPVVLGMCLACHEADEDSTPYAAGDDHTFELVARDGRLCAKCHESQATDTHVHYPIRRKRCLGCHDPHGSAYPAMMIFENLADNCYDCHEPEMKDEPHVHGPVALGQCTTCHDPHAAPNPYQLIAAGPDLCLGCHVEKAEELASHRHAHRPVVEDCNQCHDPHDGPDPNRLRKKIPDLCFGCHEDTAKNIENASYKHGALDDERSCLRCHDPHSADFSRQLREVPKDLCLSCHDKPILTPTGLLRDMRAYLEKNSVHHGPIREGDCGACHEPHGSSHPRILRKDYPRDFYAAFDGIRYELCFSCHEQSLVTEAKTDTLTGFRNGTKNLHFVHVNRPRKGRTCRACHDVHASNNPKHVTDSVPFGPTWSYTIEFEQKPDGGACGPACHRGRGYGRVKPVDNAEEGR